MRTEKMTQDQRLDYLVEKFKTDSVQYEDLKTPKDTEGKRRILRGAGKSHQRWHCMALMWRLIE